MWIGRKYFTFLFLFLLVFSLVSLPAEETILQLCDKLENEILFLSGVLEMLNEDSMQREEQYQVLLLQMKNLRASDKKTLKRYQSLEANLERRKLFIEKQKKDIGTLENQKAEVEIELSTARKALKERVDLFEQYVREQKKKMIRVGIISASSGFGVGLAAWGLYNYFRGE